MKYFIIGPTRWRTTEGDPVLGLYTIRPFESKDQCDAFMLQEKQKEIELFGNDADVSAFSQYTVVTSQLSKTVAGEGYIIDFGNHQIPDFIPA